MKIKVLQTWGFRAGIWLIVDCLGLWPSPLGFLLVLSRPVSLQSIAATTAARLVCGELHCAVVSTSRPSRPVLFWREACAAAYISGTRSWVLPDKIN